MSRRLPYQFAGVTLLTLIAAASSLRGQQRSSAEPKAWTTAEDHQHMLAQLGIHALRPGPSGNETAPNHANYDEATANPFPNLPEALTLKNGRKVTSPDVWWKQRRPEIVEDFDREVLGRVPRQVPAVTWSVMNTTQGTIGPHRVVGRQLVGHVDNSAFPAITVDIQMALVTPADAKTPVPVMIMFGGGVLPQSAGGPAPLSWRPRASRAPSECRRRSPGRRSCRHDRRAACRRPDARPSCLASC